MKRRLLAAGVAVVAATGTIGGAGVANAATDPPPLAFVVATQNVVAERYDYGDGYRYLDFDLGTNLIAGKDPFEIRATRASYADPIVAKWIGKKKTTTLPAGMVADFTGLKDFATVTIKDKSGATVKNYTTNFCPNSWASARTRPDAPAANPYPMGCSFNPFTLGGVWGIQAGWNATIDSRPQDEDFDIAAGDYTATVVVNPIYTDYFKIANGTAQLNVKVEDVDVSGPDGLAAKQKAAAARAGTAREQGAQDAEGDEHHQISAYAPGFRPPAKAPKALAKAPKTGPRPDLRSLPAWGISLEPGTNPETGEADGKWYVNFGATVWNGGTSPLLVDGFRRTGTDLMDAYQYFFDAKGNQVGSVAAGTMEWDNREGHKHWHFTDFAQYNLLSGDKKLAVRSGKEAFCLANTDAVDYTIPNAKWRPENTDLSTSCGGNTAVAVREVLDIGNGDTYSQSRPGQSFEVTDLPNGTYYIEVKANPVNKLAETSTANNTSLREIELGGTPGARTLVVPPVNGIVG
jgi:Lysyl oxidase